MEKVAGLVFEREKPSVRGDALSPAADPKPAQDNSCNSTGTTQFGSFIIETLVTTNDNTIWKI